MATSDPSMDTATDNPVGWTDADTGNGILAPPHTNSWGKYLDIFLTNAPLCSPASHQMCLPAVWCWAGSAVSLLRVFLHRKTGAGCRKKTCNEEGQQ